MINKKVFRHAEKTAYSLSKQFLYILAIYFFDELRLIIIIPGFFNSTPIFNKHTKCNNIVIDDYVI